MTKPRSNTAGSRAVVVTGPEKVVVQRAAAAEIDRLRREHPEREVKELHCGRKSDTGATMAEDIVQSAAPSLFGEPPILVVQGIDQADEAVVEALKAAISDPYSPPLVITHFGGQRGRGVINAATKAGIQVIKTGRPSDRDVRNLIRQEAAACGGRVTDRAEHWLVDALGTQSLDLLLGATRQAVADSPGGQVDEVQVQRMLPAQTRANSFQLADHVWAGQLAEATRLLRLMEQRERGVGVSVVAAIAHGLRMMALAGVRGSSAAGVAPWQAERARGNARNWGATGAKIARLGVTLPDIDADMKGGLDGGTALDDEQKMALLEQLVARLSARQPDVS